MMVDKILYVKSIIVLDDALDARQDAPMNEVIAYLSVHPHAVGWLVFCLGFRLVCGSFK